VKTFVRKVQKEFSLPIKKMRSDNGTEFKNTQVEEFLDEEGIKHEFLSPYTPQQNGVAKRKNRTLIDMARTMIDEYKTPDLFWCDAVNTACHAINRLYLHKKLKRISYELLIGNKPKVSYFRVFECKCFVLSKKPQTSKFAPKVDEGFLLGYGSNEHAYRVFNKTSGRVEIAVDVIFNESNSSQVEQVDSSVVGKEDPPCDVIKQLAIGDIRPQEDEVTEVVVPQAVDEQVFANIPDTEGEQTPAENLDSGSAAHKGGSASTPLQTAATSLTLIQGQNLQPILSKKKKMVQKINKKLLSSQGSSKPFKEITPSIIYLGVFERGY
jgi:hypothetical protein